MKTILVLATLILSSCAVNPQHFDRLTDKDRAELQRLLDNERTLVFFEIK